MAAPEPTTSPASVASAAREELLSTGPGTVPNTQVPPSGFAAAILPMLGKVLGTAGLLGASAAIPGFGQAYVQAQQHAEAQALAARGQLLRTLQKEPSLAFQPGMDAIMKKQLGPELAQSVMAFAERQRAEESLTQTIAGLVRANEPVPGVDIAAQTPAGETMSLVTPGGFGFAAGAPAPVAPYQPAGTFGDVQRETKVGPKGEVTTTVGPTATGEKERTTRLVTTRQISQRQRQLMQQYGFDATEARIAAVQEAQQYGADLSQLTTEDRGLVELAPFGESGQGSAARKAAEETAARGGAERSVALNQPPKGSYVNPETMELFPSNVKLGDIEAQGGIAVDAATKKALISSRAIEKLINDTERVTQVLFQSDDPKEAAMRALKLSELAVKRGSLDPKEKALLQALTTLQGLQARAGQLAQTIGGESGGRLSDQDIQRVFKALPGLRGDFPGITKYRETRTSSQQLISDMRSEMLTIRRSLLGQPLEGAAPAPVLGADDPAVQQMLQQLPPGTRFLGVVPPQQ